MTNGNSRRKFLKNVGAVGATAGFWTSRTFAAESSSPNEKLRIACVGTTNQAGWNLGEIAGEEIVALCDVDSNFLDRAAQKFPKAHKYADFRKMLETESPKIDAVLVATTDHVHGPASAMALDMKKHVYCEKPLAHTVAECRLLTALAAKNKLATQLGTQIHATDNYRRVVELVRAGTVGPIEEVHVWVGAGEWCDGRFHSAEQPKNLDWDLWLGPAATKPYSTGVHPRDWRKFWEFGGGVLSDLGCHRIDLAHWALDLKYPTSVWAEGPPVDEIGAPKWLTAHWEYPSRGSLPPVKLHWYHGDKRPEILKTFKNTDGSPVKFGVGVLFVGDKGAIYGDYYSNMVLPLDQYRDRPRPEQSIPKSIGHHQEWIKACKTGSPTTCPFSYSGPLTESVLLGLVAYRSGKKIEWNGSKMQATGGVQTAQFLTKEYRKGWEIAAMNATLSRLDSR